MTVTTADASRGPAAGSGAFVLEQDGDTAVLWFDLPGEKVNKFSSSVMQELDSVVMALGANREIQKLLIASRKPGIFIAGADVSEFSRVTSSGEAERFTRFGQGVFLALSRLPQVTVAVIHGACMGGGTEMALNCDYRLMTDHPKSVIALPEVKLGIFPAWTGTTKLPRLIGLPAALDMILTGRTLDAKRAKRIGLIDEIIPASGTIEAAKSYLSKVTGKRRTGGRTHFYIEGNPVARRMIFSKARKGVLAQTHGHYPAPLKAIEVMETGYREGIDQGVAAEAYEASLLVTGDISKNLVRLFFLMEEAKKDSSGVAPRKVEAAGVLGAGIMGGGIAQIVADKAGIPVRMKDIAWGALSGGMKAAAKVWQKKVEKRRLSRGEMARKLAKISTTTDWSGFSRVDVVIEAVVEILAIKQDVLSEFEAIGGADAIFASNTSTIPISQIAARATRPQNVVGMHFFNPVDKMPLVEIIAGEKSSPSTVATVAAFARKLGKTVVVCKDAPGFVVNRILAPYLNEAAFLLQEGNPIEAIDAAMVDFGMPMGPLALLDEVGIDVAAKSGAILAESFSGRMEAALPLGALLADKRHGRKNGRGLYLWKGGRRVGPDASVYKLLGINRRTPDDPPVMAEKMVLAMINEASRILDEKVVASAGELDLAMIMGTGFPPFRGGLLRYADSLGIERVISKLRELEQKHGSRFSPSPALLRMAEAGGSFYPHEPAG